MVSIIIGIAYGTEVFGTEGNIKLAYQLVYKQVIRDGNYLELTEEETITQLLNYIGKTSHLKPFRSKEKNKNIKEITLLVLSTGIQESVSLILLAYI